MKQPETGITRGRDIHAKRRKILEYSSNLKPYAPGLLRQHSDRQFPRLIGHSPHACASVSRTSCGSSQRHPPASLTRTRACQSMALGRTRSPGSWLPNPVRRCCAAGMKDLHAARPVQSQRRHRCREETTTVEGSRVGAEGKAVAQAPGWDPVPMWRGRLRLARSFPLSWPMQKPANSGKTDRLSNRACSRMSSGCGRSGPAGQRTTW